MATDAAVVFAPEVIEMHAQVGLVGLVGTLTISASDALLKDAQDAYAEKGFTECSTRDTFDSLPGSDRFFLDAGKLQGRVVGRPGEYWGYQVPDRLLRPCLAALAARGLAPAPAEPAALAAVAADPQAATEEDLDELWERAEEPGGLRSLWLPRAPPARPAGATPAGMAVLHIQEDGTVTSFEAPEDVWAEMKGRWPEACREIAAVFGKRGACKSYGAILLSACLVPALDRLGFELVAPKAFAEQAKACREQGADRGAYFKQLAGMGVKASLVFVQRTRLSAEQRCILDVHSIEEFCPPGHATVEVNANGMVSFFDAPREVKLVIEEAHPWVCNDMISSLQGTSVDFVPRLLEVLISSITSLGYKLVTAPVESEAGAYRFFRPSRPAQQPEEASLVAEEAVRAVREEFAVKLQAQADEQQALQARLAAEQRFLRDELHQALRAELMQALREHQAEVRIQAEQLQARLQALEAQQSRQEATTPVDEQGVVDAQDWPIVQIYDADIGTAGAAKHIRIACPGVDEDAITIEEHGNGVHVNIAASDQSRAEFDRDFCFDRCKDGFFELRQDECVYEHGVLLLVLKRTLPKRMKLKPNGSHAVHRSSLAAVLEEVQYSPSHGHEQTPLYYDIASANLDGSHDADSRSITSEARSWLQVDADAHASAWPSPEQDAKSIGKESLGEASQQSSWVIPNGAASSRPGASQAPSSHGSGAASLATVRSVASAPARGTAPRCFLPGTAFRREETGEYVRAAELMRAGGDKLVGPGGSQVLVSSAIKHAAVERDLVSLRLRGVSAAFVVTADHQLLARGPKDQPVARSAGEFARGTFLFDGTDFHHVEQAKLFQYTCQVVELSFEGDAAALAWVVPRRSRSSGARVPVAVLGKEPTLGDRGVCAQRTFLDVLSSAPTASAGARSRSAGSRPAFGSSWSVGSQGHDDKQPGQCDVCSRHHSYLNCLSGPNPGKAKPCPEGASCRKCHAPHPEYSGEGRSA